MLYTVCYHIYCQDTYSESSPPIPKPVLDEARCVVVFRSGKANLQWKPVAKDGADLLVNQQVMKEARVEMGPEETLDIEVTTATMKDLKPEFSAQTGSWKTAVPITVREKPTAVQKSHLH